MKKADQRLRLRKTKRRVKNLCKRTFIKSIDQFQPSLPTLDLATPELARIIPSGIPFAASTEDHAAASHFCEHRFDLLGSGWTKVYPGMHCRGFEGMRPYPAAPPPHTSQDIVKCLTKPNQKRAKRIRELIPQSYSPIDWQIDFKSGFRWNERTWYRNIRYGQNAGVDIKLPWELSRMQHLPELAIVFTKNPTETIKGEFRNQILDWIASNPPRFGVNWSCTMDVAIRVANWLIAYDLFRAAGTSFDPSFKAVFYKSVYQHAEHIIGNLEWAENRTANHYLANICGLFLAAIYLPESNRTDAWLQFSIQEIESETNRQFLPDGGHFEASTSYHRLCCEMISTCALFAQALPHETKNRATSTNILPINVGPKLSADTRKAIEQNLKENRSLLSKGFWNKLDLAIEFYKSIIRPDGSTPSIGDDDSGRFLRLGGWSSESTVTSTRERYHNLQHYDELPEGAPYLALPNDTGAQWLSFAEFLLCREEIRIPEKQESAYNAYAFSQALARRNALPAFERTPYKPTQSKPQIEQSDLNATHETSGGYTISASSNSKLTLKSFPIFGLFVASSPHFHLTVRCGNAKNDGAGVHAHEDQLSFTLYANNKLLADDPGSYTYTASPTLRNTYRGSKAHHAPSSTGRTLPHANKSPFSAPNHAIGTLNYFNSNGFQGHTSVDGGSVTRTIEFLPDSIRITDHYNLKQGWRPSFQSPLLRDHTITNSPRYGWRLL